MKILLITRDEIRFDNGCVITYCHDQECCEINFADFMQLDFYEIHDVDFDEESMLFEKVEYGFRFGNKPAKMFFVPCYSVQNGYYTNNINIVFKKLSIIYRKVVIGDLVCDQIDNKYTGGLKEKNIEDFKYRGGE